MAAAKKKEDEFLQQFQSNLQTLIASSRPAKRFEQTNDSLNPGPVMLN